MVSASQFFNFKNEKKFGNWTSIFFFDAVIEFYSNVENQQLLQVMAVNQNHWDFFLMKKKNIRAG